MSIVAEFTIPAESLPGGETLLEMPDTRIELERIVPTEESALPFFWVWGPEPELFAERAERETDVVETQLLDQVRGGALFRAEWSPESETIRGVEQLRATIIEATGTADRWRFQVRTQEQEAFTEFRQLFQRQGIPVELDRLYDLSELVEGNNRTLTDEQRETLIRAYRDGYYEAPRRTTQEELGDHFGVSHRAVSERLRRGVRNLIASTLLPSGDGT